MSGSRSGWFYAGIGCIAVLVLCAVCTAGSAFFIFRQAKTIGDEMKDPEKRAARAAEILGVERLPEGYLPVAALDWPFPKMEVAVLSDTGLESGVSATPSEMGLVYFEMWNPGLTDYEELRAYFAGESEDASLLEDNGINVSPEDILGRGTLELEDSSLMYLSMQGAIDTQGLDARGVSSLSLIECSSDSRLRLAIWTAPGPPDAAPVPLPGAEGGMAPGGSAADPASIARFLGQFAFCD